MSDIASSSMKDRQRRRRGTGPHAKSYYLNIALGYHFEMQLIEFRHFLTLVISVLSVLSSLSTAARIARNARLMWVTQLTRLERITRLARSTRMALLGLFIVMNIAAPTHASPAPLAPDLDQPASADAVKSAPAERLIIDTINITPVGPVGESGASDGGASEYFFPYRQALSPRLGTAWNSEAASDGESLLYLAGFQFRAQSRRLKNYEAGIDLISDSTGRLSVARHWFFSRARFRPFAKAGGALKLVPREGLATVLKLENYFARGAIGFEQMLLTPLSFRMELEAAAGLEAFEVIVSAGYSWAW
jgi:hypothetical protein